MNYWRYEELLTCPLCGNPEMYTTHNIAEMLVRVCDECDKEFPFTRSSLDDYYVEPRWLAFISTILDGGRMK